MTTTTTRTVAMVVTLAVAAIGTYWY